MRFQSVVARFVLALPFVPARAQTKPDNFAPYRFLIGEWDVGKPGESPMMMQYFRWGPGESYVLFGAATLSASGKLDPHFDGLLAWNGVRKNLDMLVVLDLDGGGRMQEQGTLSFEAAGKVTREITATYSEELRPSGSNAGGAASGGWTARFRQTFERVSGDTIITTVMRETKDGWVATFPGSERLMMTRRR